MIKKYLHKILSSIINFTHTNFGIPNVFNDSISLKYIKKFLPSAPVIIECGAFDGKDSLKLQKILKGFVHSIEANPESFEKLTRTTSNNNLIKPYNIGLSEFTGKRLLNISSGGSESASSFLSPNDKMSKEVRFENKIEVNCYTLIDFAQMNNISRINFLYLDMQGIEYYVLKGSLDLIKKIDAIYLEVCFVETYEGEVLFDIVNSLLLSNGFELKKIANPLNAKHGNALYVNNKIK